MSKKKDEINVSTFCNICRKGARKAVSTRDGGQVMICPTCDQDVRHPFLAA